MNKGNKFMRAAILCLLLIDLIALGFSCWILWAPETEDDSEAALLEKYETHEITLEYGQHITVYTLREHYDTIQNAANIVQNAQKK